METLAQDSPPGAGRGKGMFWGLARVFRGTWCLTLGSGYMGAHHGSLHFMCRLCIYETVYDTLKK